MSIRTQKKQEARRLQQRGLLQEQIAQRLGVTQATISRWLNPPPKHLVNAHRSHLALAVTLDNSGPMVAAEHLWPVYKEPMAPAPMGYPAREFSLEAMQGQFGELDELTDSSLDPAELVEQGIIS